MKSNMRRRAKRSCQNNKKVWF